MEKNFMLSDDAMENVAAGSGFLTTTYEVKAGDTLSAIALKFHTTVELLCQTNGIENPDRIYVGQILMVPNL